MTQSQDYVEKVVVAIGAAGDTQIAPVLAERCGYGPGDIQSIQTLVEPARAAARRMNDASDALDRASGELKTGLKDLKTNLSGLRQTMNNNLSRTDPLFKKLGMDQDQPIAQEALFAYAENVFTQGKSLTKIEGALLAQRKWDAPRFTAALAQVAAVRAANVRQEIAKGESIAATAAFYNAIDALDELFRPFAKNARANLADIPGALEKMELQAGIPVKPQRPLPASERKKVAPVTPQPAG
jgi:hypothetical protein